MGLQFFFHLVAFNIFCNAVISAPISVKSTAMSQEGNNTLDLNQNINVMIDANNNMHIKIQENIPRSRVKRQNSGAGRFAEASKMAQIKLLRLFLQMFKNAWDRAYVGGSHPLHHNVPKVIVALYKEKVVEFFIPDVGQEKDMQ